MQDSTPPPPVYVQPPDDPALAILQKQTQEQNIQAMQRQSTLDTAHLMQRFGIGSALSGSPVSLSSSAGVALAAIGAK